MHAHNRTYHMLLFFFVVTLAVIPLSALPVRLFSSRLVTLMHADTVTHHVLTDEKLMTYEDSVFENISSSKLTDAGIGLPMSGDRIILSYVLPEIRCDVPAVLIKTRGASLAVRLDGEEIFSHFEEEGRSPLEKWGSHFVELPSEFQGKTLEIIMEVAISGGFTGVCPPVLGNHADLMQHVTYLGLLPLLTALFVCSYAVFFIILSFFFAMRFPEIRTQLYVALICLMSGLWLLAYHELLTLMSVDTHSFVYEYILQFAAVPAYYLYLNKMVLPLKYRRHRILAIVLSVISILVLPATVVFGLHYHLYMGLYSLMLLAGLFVLVRFYIDAFKYRSTDPAVMIQMTGLSILFVCIIIQVILTYLEDRQGVVRGILGRNIMTFGIALFLESQLIHYFVFVTRRFAERMEKTELEEMAYRDFLTKLPNRTDAERVFLQMTKTARDFCVVMFDLNDLKEVNDKNGHDAGDHLLVEFAQALRVSFDEGSYLARIGGDEFVAVMEGISEQAVERHLRTLTDALHRLDIIEPHIAHPVSYGYAFRHECAENEAPQPRSVFQMVHGPADFSDVDYNFTLNRRRQDDKKTEVKEENIKSSESKYAMGDDILQRVMSLADRRMYERKHLIKIGRGQGGNL